MSKSHVNELHPELLSMLALNSFAAHNSSPRAVMYGSHVGQSLVVDGAEPKRIYTGVEAEYGKYTFNVKFPCNAQIVKCIERYRPTRSQGSIKESPETVIVYENLDNNKELGMLVLPRHHKLDKQFGFSYVRTKHASKVMPGEIVPKGMVIADSPAVGPSGDYAYGVNANVAFMSVPQIIEDGVVIRKGYLDKLRTSGYESRVASWGKNKYPLNLYGDENNYKPFPDIGDTIRDDGLLFVLRSYDELLAPIKMNPENLREPNFYYDFRIYGAPGAVITDVTVHHDKTSDKHTPRGMEEQAAKYSNSNTKFYEELLSVYWSYRKKRGGDENTRLSPELHRLVVEALADKGTVRVAGKDEKVTRTFKRNNLDNWRVEVHYKYPIEPTIGFKVTGSSGF